MVTKGKQRRRPKRSFGSIRRLPSGRYQATYSAPNGSGRQVLAPHTFLTRLDAEGWLTDQSRLISRGEWRDTTAAPATIVETFGQYAARWLSARDLKPRTAELYRSLLDRRIMPTFGETPMQAVSAAMVRDWYARQGTSAPTARAHAYALLRSICGSAVEDGILPIQPCAIRGASSTRRARSIRVASPAELVALAAAMPPRYRAMVLLASSGALRFGEVSELRRCDLADDLSTVRVSRAVARVKGSVVVGSPKSHAGTRVVHLPPHLAPALAEHLAEHVEPGHEALLFPAPGGGHLAPSSLHRMFARARREVGRDDLRFHDLRHSGAVLAALSGATISELMSRLGHSSPGMALRYQHTAEGRDRVIADRLSELAGQ